MWNGALRSPMGELAFGRGGAAEGEVVSGKRKTDESDETGEAIMKGTSRGKKELSKPNNQ